MVVFSLTLKVWRQVFKATWKTHRSSFRPIIEDLGRHKRLVESQAGLIEFEEIQALKTKVDEEFTHLRKTEELKQQNFVRDWLNAASVEEDYDSKSNDRSGYPGVCRWILAQRKFELWKDFNSTANPFLWITGIPGAGKLLPL